MPKPLRSEDPKPKSVQFSHFGVLDDGQRSKGAAITSVVINVTILLLVIVVGLVVKTNPQIKKQIDAIYLPPPQPQPPPPPPVKRPPPPKQLPPPPTPPKPTPVPPVPVPEIKPLPTPPKPVVPTPAPPKAITPPPAPVKIDLGNKAVSIPNKDLNPTAVRMGMETNPLAPTGPAVSNINLGNAGAKTNPGNTGLGPNATKVVLGSGNPNGKNVNGTGPGAVQITGLRNGTYGSNGPANSGNIANRPVNLGNGSSQTTQGQKPVVVSMMATPPKVLYKPVPVYSAEAKAIHLEGNVSMRIRVTSTGAVEVLQVVHSLGHGLDESARQAIQGTRFKPALDGSGNPVDWEGTVLVNFQLS